MAAQLRFSVLDQSPIAAGSDAAQALRNTIDLARLADAAGYHRYWVAEHHGGPMLAGPSPEALIGPIAAATSRDVRPPARPPPGCARRLREQLGELLALLDDSLPASHPFARLGATLPGRPEAPRPWLLGSSEQSAIWAGQLGLPYAFADFINPSGAAAAEIYRAHFQPSGWAASPQVAVAAWAICAEDDDEAERLSASSRMAMRMLRRGRLIPVPPVDQALRFLAADDQGDGGRRLTFGSPPAVRAALDDLAGRYGAEEVIVVTITHDHEARRRSYELIAEAFALTRRPELAVAAGRPAG